MGRISINRNAVELVEEMMNKQDELKITITELDNGATVIDGGIDAEGSYLAGKYFSKVCLANLGQVKIDSINLKDYQLPGLIVTVDHPVVGCMASQYAGWMIDEDDYFTIASGPGRTLARAEDLFEEIDYEDDADEAVLIFEGDKLPPDSIIDYLVEKMSIKAEDLYILIAPTASLVGSIQINSRIVETGLHKMLELGFDLTQVKQGWGKCPIAPVAVDDLEAIGRTNDAVLYGGVAYYTVEAEDDELEELITKIPSQASEDYGEKFIELYQRYGNFYDIDPMLFSPAQVVINNLKSGRVFTAGEINYELLINSLF